MSASFLFSRRLGLVGVLAALMLLVACAASFCEQKPVFKKDESIPSDAIVLFDGKDLSSWVIEGTNKPGAWKLEKGYMEARGGSLQSKQQFQDCQLHVEFWVPPMGADKERANSGVYLNDDFEVQILDSYGATAGIHDCGAIYSLTAPMANASRPAEQWQSFDILFYAPRFDEKGNKTTDARMSVLHNGVWVHNNVSIPYVTEAHGRKCRATGPVRLQDHGFKVRVRNVWIRPLSEAK